MIALQLSATKAAIATEAITASDMRVFILILQVNPVALPPERGRHAVDLEAFMHLSGSHGFRANRGFATYRA